jgi:hypothetical protein
MFEYLAISGALNKTDVDDSSSLLKLLVDIKFYDAGISREVYFRPSDVSSVFSNGNRQIACYRFWSATTFLGCRA